jgi:hypothetical protein
VARRVCADTTCQSWNTADGILTTSWGATEEEKEEEEEEEEEVVRGGSGGTVDRNSGCGESERD